MNILDRYIGIMVVGGTLLVMAVFLSLFSFAAFLSGLHEVGRGSYGLLQAAEEVVLSLPRYAYQLFPVSALLGSMIGLGLLASNSELIVIRAAGVSLWRIVLSVMKAGGVLMVVAVLLGDLVAPPAEEYAQEMRSSALSGGEALNAKKGFWTRDGASFVNVQAILPGGELAGLRIYEFDGQHRLRTVINARHASYVGGRWLLKAVVHSELGGDRVSVRHLPELAWTPSLNPGMLDDIVLKPERLSIPDLHRYIDYLQENNLNTAPYVLAMWSKIILPFTTGVMVILSVPFVFGSLRKVGIGHRILVGALVGIGFYLFNELFGYAGLAIHLHPVVSAIFPTVLFLVLSIILMRRVY